MSAWDTSIKRVLGHEGGYVNNPKDPGGETNWGITIAVARANGYPGSMRAMPRETAVAIYRKLYWDTIRGDQLPPAVAFQVFDAGVNHGVARASQWLQECVGTAKDGKIGPATLAAVAKFKESSLTFAFLALRTQFYTDLGTWNTFGKGWTRRIAGNLRYAAQDIS